MQEVSMTGQEDFSEEVLTEANLSTWIRTNHPVEKDTHIL